jgi:hypothetical protein
MELVEEGMTIRKSLEIQRARENRAILANLHQIAGQPVVRNAAPAEAAEEAGNNNGDAQR